MKRQTGPRSSFGAAYEFTIYQGLENEIIEFVVNQNSDQLKYMYFDALNISWKFGDHCSKMLEKINE